MGEAMPLALSSPLLGRSLTDCYSLRVARSLLVQSASVWQILQDDEYALHRQAQEQLSQAAGKHKSTGENK